MLSLWAPNPGPWRNPRCFRSASRAPERPPRGPWRRARSQLYVCTLRRCDYNLVSFFFLFFRNFEPFRTWNVILTGCYSNDHFFQVLTALNVAEDYPSLNDYEYAMI